MRTSTCDSTRAVKIHVTLTETSSPSKSLIVAPRSREKSSFLFFHRRHKTKELRLPPLLLPLPTKTPFPLLSIDGQGAFTISSSLAAQRQSVNQSSVVVVVPSKKTKGAQNPKAILAWHFGWQSRKAGRVRFISHHPSSCVVFFLQSPPHARKHHR